MAIYLWVNIGSGNGLLPDSTKPLPKPMLTYYRGIHLRAISREVQLNIICNMLFEFTFLKVYIFKIITEYNL